MGETSGRFIVRKVEEQMAVRLMDKFRYFALALSLVLVAGISTYADRAQADEQIVNPFGTVELIAQSAASRALAAHCSGSTRGVFRTTRAYIDFLVTNARALTGRTFQDDLISCSEGLPNLGTEGFGALQALHAVCLELRANAATCNFVKRQQNLYVTVRS
jgi:hypothetical protein